MYLWSRWKARRSIRGVGLSLYRRGMSLANQHDFQGAMEHYTAAIEMVDAPEDVRAMALYNRALLYVSDKSFPKAVADLNAVLAISTPLRQIKSAARQKLDRMKHGQCPDVS
jgi:tetratricopeptide (TPR) repeat protein